MFGPPDGLWLAPTVVLYGWATIRPVLREALGKATRACSTIWFGLVEFRNRQHRDFVRVQVASLKIVRDSGYADSIRAYDVVIDGQKAGELRDGEIKEFPISCGQHRVSLKIDWCGSKTIQFTAADENELTFCARSSLRGPRLVLGPWYVLLMWNRYITLTMLL